jgi:hypothetical protein
MVLKKSEINWTGIAALITAIGGVIGVLYTNSGKDADKEKVQRVQESVFNTLNTRVALLEYRVTQLEPKNSAFIAPARPQFMVKYIVTDSANVDHAAVALPSFVDTHTDAATDNGDRLPTFKEIRQTAESGGVFQIAGGRLDHLLRRH